MTPPGDRLQLIDSLRGYALMGLFLVHCVELFELHWAHPQPSLAFDTVFALFAGKAFALFALCFGLSFSLIFERARARGEAPEARFAWRLFLLLLIGIAHSLVYRGDILQLLAPLGLMLLAFDRIGSNRLLIVIAALSFLQPPLIARAMAAAAGAEWANAPPLFMAESGTAMLTDGSFADVLRVNLLAGRISAWSYYVETGRLLQIVGLFLVGLVLGRIRFFSEPDRFVRHRRWIGGAAGAIMVGLWASRPWLLAAIDPGAPPALAANLGWLLSGWIALCSLALQIVLFVETFQALHGRILGHLAPAGRMTLSLYVGQSLVFVPVFYGFGLDLHDDLSGGEALLLGLVSFALQLVLARWWFARFQFGPLEWLWRAGTRRSLDVPFARRASA